MANLVKLANGGMNAGVFYSHSISSPNERERDVIWGGTGDDVIIGDNETWAIYPPDFGFSTPFTYYFGGASYFEDGYVEFSPTQRLVDAALNDMDAQEGSFDGFYKYNPTDTNRSEFYSFDELLIGGAGNDTILGMAGNDWIVGGTGDDHLYGGADHDLIEGGDDNDTIDVSDIYGEYDAALGGSGNDQVTIDLADYADGGEGLSDKLIIKNVNAAASFDLNLQVNGTAFTKNFEILEYNGGNFSDAVWGGAQGDKIDGNGGDDTIDGRAGNDKLYGGDGFDIIHGGEGQDLIEGGAGADIIYDDEGEDTVFGGAGNDIIWTGKGNDVIRGGAGDDFIGEAGEDGKVSDRIRANDTLYGDEGNDRIFAGTGNDIVDGGAGNDLIVGGLGVDKMSGGTGVDTFVFRAEDLDKGPIVNGTVELKSIDVILDFSDADKIDLSGLKSLVSSNKLFFDPNHLGATEPGEVFYSELGNSIIIGVNLDWDADAEVQIELSGLNFGIMSGSSLENHILL